VTKEKAMDVNPKDVMRGRYMTLTEVVDILPVSKATIYRQIRLGRFPRPRRFGAGMSIWITQEVMDCIDNLPVSNMKNPRIRKQENEDVKNK
tara:strand:- start:2472 stop:2747 length:276 start_codon:yes stop_codon:yes gene_type:complete